ncbi:MAG: EAL domain-containing protein [Azovibrio sp.]|uniref:sensor domain-containing phosphodiesterase n=1 Tax=Azovibrio sp. TaxID=1872673 RepID=UPI003C7391CD
MSAPTHLPSRFPDINACITNSSDGYQARPPRLDGITLSSHYQPIFSLSHRRPVGHEALMRPRNRANEPISPLQVLQSVSQDFEQLLELDRLCRALHLANFAGQRQRPGQAPGWLFLNMNAEVFLQGRARGEQGFLLDACQRAGVAPQRLVIEVLEDAVQDVSQLQNAVDYFRDMGCLIALDDFGAGHSNFDRVWRLKPEIVKLDRSLIVSAAADSKLRRFMAQMVQLLHEAGAMVLVEGIETLQEAYIALEGDVDFVQGYYFGRPNAERVSHNAGETIIDKLWSDFDHRWRDEKAGYQEAVAPYINAIGYASVLLSAERSLEEACASFLDLPQADFCYVLDAAGQQIGTNLYAQVHPACDIRFAPLADAQSARWARRPYFRRALENFGKVQVTRPYLSVASAQLCVTLSASFKVKGETRVICGDIIWNF